MTKQLTLYRGHSFHRINGVFTKCYKAALVENSTKIFAIKNTVAYILIVISSVPSNIKCTTNTLFHCNERLTFVFSLYMSWTYLQELFAFIIGVSPL